MPANETPLKHKVLVVDDEKKVGKSLGRLLSLENIEYVYCTSAKEALKSITSAQTPFSLILSDQRMPEIMGIDFIERAKTITPDTICFLITAYSDLKTIIDSVNKGSVYHYITKPWSYDELVTKIKSALKKYETIIKHKALLNKAVKQNKKLYTLDCNLMAATDKINLELETLDREVGSLEDELKRTASHTSSLCESIIPEIENEFASLGKPDTEMMDRIYMRCVQMLYNDFEDLANRSGFSMPQPIPENSI